MCGIAGIVGDRDRAGAVARVRAMAKSLERRGPDAEGIEEWPMAVFGHRRLSIYDTSDLGRQPMLSPDRRIGVVFNGAIYNFLALRRELEAKGYRFASRTDTEVLVHGYREWGIDSLVLRLRGMFAFGIWDDAEQRLFLVRDRLGVKPMIYRESGGTLAFASTARALKDSGIAIDIDDQAVTEFLEFGYVTDGRTIYQGVQKLPAAAILEWSPGRDAVTRTYWQPAEALSGQSISLADAAEQAESILLDAVRLRLEADVPVGALLSAGIDSSLICWAIAKLGGRVCSFTVGTPGDPMDESGPATQTAQRLGIEHRLIEVTAAESPGVEELVSAYGEPFACASALGMLRVCRAVRSEATVLLTGDGGDDVFLGYPEHQNFFLAQRMAKWTPAGATSFWQVARKCIPHSGVLGRAVHFADYAVGGLGAIAQVHDGLPQYWKHGLLGDRLREATVRQREIPWSAESGRNALRDFLRYDRETRFAGEYLTKVDGGAMHYAVEARSPFLDQKLWEFAGALPFEVRLRGGRLKAVLREIARKHLGPELADAPKRGFGVPVNRWLAGKWAPDFRGAMEDSLLATEGYINSEAVLALHKERAAGESVPNQLWYLYVLEHWFRYEAARSPLTPEMSFTG